MSNNQGGFMQDATEKARELAHTAKEKMTEAGNAVKESAHSAKHTANEKVCCSQFACPQRRWLRAT